MNAINRRLFLKMCSAGVTMFWPTIKVARAQNQAELPKLLICIRNCNGVTKDGWGASARGNDLVLKPTLAPLEENKRHLVIMENLDARLKNGHGGACRALGGVQHTGNKGSSRPQNISVDVHIAQRLALLYPEVPLPFTCIGVSDANRNMLENYANYANVSSLEEGQPVVNNVHPQSIFDNWFQGLTSSNDDPDLTQVQRQKSLLDLTLKGLRSINSQLSASERIKIEYHTDGIRELEKRLQDPGRAGFATLPRRPGKINPFNNDGPDFERRLDMTYDILTVAAAMRRSMVITLDHECGQGRIKHTQIGVKKDHHSVSHGNKDVGGDLELINRFYCRKLNRLANLFKQYKEGDGTMLDNALIFQFNTIGMQGSTHTIKDLPYMLLGSAGGALQTGRLVDGSQTKAENMLFSLIKFMLGGNPTSFGKAQGSPIESLHA